MYRIGLGRRLAAFVLDFALVVLAGKLLLPWLGAGPDLSGARARLLISGLAAAYFLVEGICGRTPGKMIMRIVVRDQFGARAPLPRLLLRFLVKNLWILCSLLAALTGLAFFTYAGNLTGLALFIGFLFVLSRSRLAFHDLVSGTAVFPSAPPPGPR
ncbi:MAG: RDD family protein [Desulfovibrionaceae bacterium]|nr:RDD family protein [Desulfovibrionaceae bacterium]